MALTYFSLLTLAPLMVLSLVPTIILLVVAWKVMRAQEMMARALRDLANRPNPQA